MDLSENKQERAQHPPDAFPEMSQHRSDVEATQDSSNDAVHKVNPGKYASNLSKKLESHM